MPRQWRVIPVKLRVRAAPRRSVFRAIMTHGTIGNAIA